MANSKSGAVPTGKPIGFPIVGIGASAGGLEALTTFFQAMPPEPGIAFVLVVHLDPQHVSILPELLQKQTAMTVLQAADGLVVKPNHVYVIPPNRNLTILNGTLQLLDLTPSRGINLPIDSFLRSLAQDQERNAACVVLSGTGSDGTLGLKAIKSAFGLVLAQDEESAKYDGMPRSAVSTGLVDFVLPPQEIPAQLIRCLVSKAGRSADAGVSLGEPFLQALQKVFVILRARTGHDFSHYKVNTIARRIERRMNIHQIGEIDDYIRYLRESDREAEILFKELLIGVTGFFRDPAAFEALATKILPEFLADKPNGYQTRIWVPGCATGEEAYSLAILFHETAERMQRSFHVQVFGTDIDDEAIATARLGVYPHGALEDLSPERVSRFFDRETDNRYRIKKQIREKLVFAAQDLIKDPPFTKLSMLSCRNLLIYLDGHLQRRLLPMFNYCLAPGGLLFLGSSETAGLDADLFSVLDKKWKIFRRKSSAASVARAMEITAPRYHGEPAEREPRNLVQRAEELSAMQLAETILQQSNAAPCAIVNDLRNVVYIHGRTGRFLEPAQGRASANILEMARPGLRAALSAGLRKAAVKQQEVVAREIRIESEQGVTMIDLSVRPLLGQGALQDLMLVVFDVVPMGPAAEESGKSRKTDPASSRTVKELEDELLFTREDLQTTIEELETSNEELRSANEELQSTNEELQSTNEELETSKEELQSMNEESVTVNQELQARVDELGRVNDDLANLLDSTEIATVFLDGDLRVRRFTPRATDIIPLTVADFGRPIEHFATRLPGADLADQSRKSLKDLSVQRVEVEDREERVFSVRTRPYRTAGNLIDGVVITFEDISEFKKLEYLRRLAVVLGVSEDAVMLLNREGRFLAWNRGAEQLYGYGEADALEMGLVDLAPPDLVDEAMAVVDRAYAGKIVPTHDSQRIHQDGRILLVQVTVTLIHRQEDQPSFVFMTERLVGDSNRPRSG